MASSAIITTTLYAKLCTMNSFPQRSESSLSSMKPRQASQSKAEAQSNLKKPIHREPVNFEKRSPTPACLLLRIFQRRSKLSSQKQKQRRRLYWTRQRSETQKNSFLRAFCLSQRQTLRSPVCS